jgi:O-antigen ligase
MIRPRVSRAAFRHPAAVWGPRLTCAILLVWAAGEWVGFLRALTTLTLIGFVAAIAGIRNPALGLLGVGLLAVLDPISRHLVLNAGGLLRWNSFNYLLVFVTLLYLPVVWRMSDPHSRLLRLLIAILALGMLLPPRWEPGLQTLLNISTVFAIVIYVQRTSCDYLMMFWLGVVMSVAAAAGGFEYYRHAGMLPEMNKNAFAMFPLAGLFGACLALPFAGGIRGGQLLLASLASMDLAWVFLSRSRGSLLLGLIAMGFLLISIRTLPRRLTSVTAAALLIAGASGHFDALQADAARRFSKMLDQRMSLEERTSGRGNLALGGWRIFTRHPLGVGTGGFEDAWAELEQIDNSTRFAQGKLVPAHSAWVMVLAENGLPGLVVFTMFVGSFAVIGLRKRDPTLRRLGVFTTIILAAAFGTTEFQSKALWFVAAAATALLHQRRYAMARSQVRARPRLRRRPRPLVQPAPVEPVTAHG